MTILAQIERAIEHDFPGTAVCFQEFVINLNSNGGKERSAAGRACAEQSIKKIQQTLTQKIAEPIGISKNDRGVPLFPSPLIGSISHSKHLATAIVGQKDAPYSSVGIDIETNFPKALRILSKIATAKESALVPFLGYSAEESASALFCLKEAFYKALNVLPGTDGMLMNPSWKDLRVCDVEGSEVAAEFTLSNAAPVKFSIRLYKTHSPIPFVCSVVACNLL